MMREAYRLEKTGIERGVKSHNDGGLDKKLCIAFIYMGKRKVLPGLDAFRKEIRGLLESMTLS